jgi:ribonuclease P protein component
MDQGCRSRTPRLDVFWLPNGLGHPRLGVVVPLHGDTAVRRNRLRRRLREAMRRQWLPRLDAVDVVVRARPKAYGSAWPELQGDLDRCLSQLAR